MDVTEIVERPETSSVSLKKMEANRRNAQRSTGPRTAAGKRYSRRNAVKHSLLASSLLIKDGPGTEDKAAFEGLWRGLCRDLQPVGRLEEMLVEEIAVCWWRKARALKAEAGLVRLSHTSDIPQWNLERAGFTDQLAIPLDPKLHLILRYDAAIEHRLVSTLNRLERLQRTRRGERLPPPVNLQITNDSGTEAQ